VHTKTKSSSESAETENWGAVNEPSGFVASKKMNEVQDVLWMISVQSSIKSPAVIVQDSSSKEDLSSLATWG
jgi:hypothetical protein